MRINRGDCTAEIMLHAILITIVTALLALTITLAFTSPAHAASAQNAENDRSARDTGNLATPRATSAATDATNNTVTLVQNVWYEFGDDEYFDPGVDVRAAHAVVHCWVGQSRFDFNMDGNGQATNTITHLPDGADLHCWININSGIGFHWIQSVTINDLMDGERIELHYPLDRFYQMYMAAVVNSPAIGAKR